MATPIIEYIKKITVIDGESPGDWFERNMKSLFDEYPLISEIESKEEIIKHLQVDIGN